jgi:hypothetical protein
MTRRWRSQRPGTPIRHRTDRTATQIYEYSVSDMASQSAHIDEKEVRVAVVDGGTVRNMLTKATGSADAIGDSSSVLVRGREASNELVLRVTGQCGSTSKTD